MEYKKLDGAGCVLGLMMGAAMMFFAPLIGVLFGAFAGWVVGLFFSPTIIGFLTRVGIDTAGLSVWEVGASMGFLGGFLKTSVSSVKRD